MLSFENQNIEYKQEYVEDIRKEVIAFANGEGGIIYVGIRKDGTPVGITDPDGVMVRIANSLKDAISPDVMPFVALKTISLDGLSIVEITVSTGTNRPYYIREKGLKPSGVYVRKGSSSQPMTDEGIREMIRQTSGQSYENGRSLRQDLTFVTLQTEMAKREIPLEKPNMQSLHLIGEDKLFTNLAYLLSDQCEYTTKVALFQGSDKAVFRDRKEFSGSLLLQLAEVYHYIDIANKTKATFTGLHRLDTRDYPDEAVREALLNAIVHRDYSYSSSNLIHIYDDRIEFVSIGGLVPGFTLESIYLGVSAPRNPRLAQIFFQMRLIESYGTGVGKIQRNYKGSAVEPVFETAPGVFRVTLPNVNESMPDMPAAIPEDNPDALEQPLDKKTIILDYVSEAGYTTRADIEELLGVGTTKAFQLLKELCTEKKLLSVGKGKGTRYILPT